jgi:hypothetical protein
MLGVAVVPEEEEAASEKPVVLRMVKLEEVVETVL